LSGRSTDRGCCGSGDSRCRGVKTDLLLTDIAIGADSLAVYLEMGYHADSECAVAVELMGLADRVANRGG